MKIEYGNNDEEDRFFAGAWGGNGEDFSTLLLKGKRSSFVIEEERCFRPVRLEAPSLFLLRGLGSKSNNSSTKASLITKSKETLVLWNLHFAIIQKSVNPQSKNIIVPYPRILFDFIPDSVKIITSLNQGVMLCYIYYTPQYYVYKITAKQ
uniref:Uncharacterized protein n=1 Tax=Salix viminalis TaxID=40686 RepID=A0A6N2M0F9_SALVM